MEFFTKVFMEGHLLVLRLAARLRDFVGHKILLERTVEVQGDDKRFNHLRDQLIVSTPIDVSKTAEVKYPDYDIYVENVILYGNLIALPFEGYGMILGMYGCLNITLKYIVDRSWLSLTD
ncbi:hypothetical protein M9H77_27206 [Catharanthus roseus]|uniref:Uncharacterized protein n=1 Tax=Catharanthus roseus TaxID=4058 RepID=A0ACC0AEL2_CATRO|nr:hypothetical protein M9H77_00111 [Catharanthus roseus]KAI5658413.1 hypothetical protein M9H77_27206 [Catharanthus roseus]